MDPVADEWLVKISSLRLQARGGGDRAWHKPLLLLVALRNVRAGRDRMLPKGDYADTVGVLLDEFQPQPTPGRARTSNPWLHLPNDGVWEITGTAITDLGGIPEPYWSRLAADRALVADTIGLLLHQYLPASLHDDVLAIAGLTRRGLPDPTELANDPTMPARVRQTISRLVRDPQFVTAVIARAGAICAVCRYDGQIDGRPVGIEAAHVRGLAEGGPDVPTNGWALCVLHHRLFDRGLFTIDPTPLRLLISPRFAVSSHADPLTRYKNRPLAPDATAGVDLDQFGWHRDVAFLA